MTWPQNEVEWRDSVSAIVQAMLAHVEPFVTPLSTVIRDGAGKPIEGRLLGTGSYISAMGQIILITNDHNLSKLDTSSIGLQLRGNDHVFQLHCPTYSAPYPWDVGFSRIDPKVWNLPKLQPHTAAAIPQGRLAPAHQPAENELLFFAGYAWQGSTFLYDTLLSRGTPYLMREVPLPEGWGEERFHFAIDYRPDLAETVGRGAGLPRPDGFSGSLVWNTHFVECVMQGKEWSPEYAEVTGIVWGWPSATGCLVATRIEYIRSFLLHAIDMMVAKEEVAVS